MRSVIVLLGVAACSSDAKGMDQQPDALIPHCGNWKSNPVIVDVTAGMCCGSYDSLPFIEKKGFHCKHTVDPPIEITSQVPDWPMEPMAFEYPVYQVNPDTGRAGREWAYVGGPGLVVCGWKDCDVQP